MCFVYNGWNLVAIYSGISLVKPKLSLVSGKIVANKFYSTNSSPDENVIKIIPMVTYYNADTLKLDILYDNKNKAGIYRWINKINNKIYVGSSVNLALRFRNYFSINFLEIGRLSFGLLDQRTKRRIKKIIVWYIEPY